MTRSERVVAPSGRLMALALVGVGCMGEVEGDRRPPFAGPAGEGVLAGMTWVAEARLSDSRRVAFYESEGGLVIRETGSVDDLAQRPLDLDGWRRRGMTEMFRELVGDANTEVPAALIGAEQRWLVRREAGWEPRPSRPPEDESGARDSRLLEGDIQALSEDGEWWQGLPLCQAVESTGGFEGPAWYDEAWCPVDVTWANTGFRDTMYYEATGFGQGGAATIAIYKRVGDDWQRIIHQDIAHRTYQRFSLPPENGAVFRTTVTGELDANGEPATTIGISERYRLAMPEPALIDFAPSRAGYSFSNDLNGITHDANDFYMTRTDHSLGAPVGGWISKTPITGSLGREPPRVVAMPAAWANKGQTNLVKYDHFGDLVHVDGFLFVAMEGPAGAAVAVFDTNLTAIGYAVLDANERSCPWLAFNPRNRSFYVSFGQRKPIGIFTIRVNGNSVVAARLGTLHTSGPIGDQGAKFSPRGNLWSVRGYGGANTLRLFGTDSVNGHVHFSRPIPSNGGDEAEGLDIIDFDADRRAPGMSGQLHVQTLENFLIGSDKFSFGHFRADMNRL